MTAIHSQQQTWIGPNTAFVLVIFGFLGIYCELMWPGRIFGALLGMAGVATGVYVLYGFSPSRLSLVLIGVSVVLFGTEAFYRTFFIGGVLGTAGLAAGFCVMFHHPPSIVPGLAVPVCCVFGAVTSFLCYVSRRSRSNKWFDIKAK